MAVVSQVIARLYGSRMTFIAIVLLVLPAIGTAGYMLIEGWGWFDALYMTIITLTTVGYLEVHPLSDAGRWFTIIYIFFGVGTAFYSLTLLAERVLRSERVTRRLARRLLRTMNNHFIVCGYGRTGRRIVSELNELGKSYVVVDSSEQKVADLLQRGIPVVVGDASLEETLHQAGIARAAGLVTALNNDAANVFVVLSARELNEQLHIVARAENISAETKLKRAGANAVLSPYEIGAVRLTHMLLQRRMIDTFELVTNKLAVDVSIEEFLIGPAHSMSNRSLGELDLRRQFQAIVLAVKHPDETIDFPPNPHTVLQPGSVLIVAAAGDQMKEVHNYFVTSTVEGG